jgi:hypothetical protein
MRILIGEYLEEYGPGGRYAQSELFLSGSDARRCFPKLGWLKENGTWLGEWRNKLLSGGAGDEFALALLGYMSCFSSIIVCKSGFWTPRKDQEPAYCQVHFVYVVARNGRRIIWPAFVDKCEFSLFVSLHHVYQKQHCYGGVFVSLCAAPGLLFSGNKPGFRLAPLRCTVQ